MSPRSPSREADVPYQLTEPLEADLPRERRCGALARRFVEERYGSQLDGRTLEDLKLVVSELVDNAYVHGKGTIQLKLQRLADGVRIDVLDEGIDAKIEFRKLGAHGGGHGLRLVDHLCPAWGSFQGRTHVWAEMPIAQAG
jgi:anti-sigma regulatory factor (Ser/Thr protein kinase)